MSLFEVDVPAVGEKLEPVLIEIVRGCHFKRKADVDGHRKLGCERCGRAKKDPVHMGQPPSVNPLGSGDPRAYQALKQQWQGRLLDELALSDLPRRLERVMVEGEVVFPDRTRRDQGNFRFLIEKALGDALVEGGFIRDDDWARYEFGNLSATYQKGVSATRLMLFPTAA